ncbi:uncharacterized protein NDAI_0B00570 [Naumovozyma dairenensis CBS 421]|uniref:Uncharacterized protein n=1 Tax=Naumovozyma dairenensis (strain ATCC 10597 / BCRC 20456 / CBS 421 / NBRC 0211 / NRRL Y-12639) TaxID=1071378 RepID=G0W5M8_NAUDC|nr:hypothetical protein NDAI_0B00570 [Naumovozyma dairenensis CBS 421]CCD23089.1 hypothetical protein NDAI_0B00570 [Naumovozyma dairenensis CBS 421]
MKTHNHTKRYNNLDAKRVSYGCDNGNCGLAKIAMEDRALEEEDYDNKDGPQCPDDACDIYIFILRGSNIIAFRYPNRKQIIYFLYFIIKTHLVRLF